MAAKLTGLANDLQRWGRDLSSPPREWEYREFLLARDIATSLAIDMRRMAKNVTRGAGGARSTPNTGRRRSVGLRRSAWLVKATGPVHWWEWGTRPHWLVASGANTSKRAVRRAKRQAAGRTKGRPKAVLHDRGTDTEYGVYAYVRGMPARSFWFRGLDHYWPSALQRSEPRWQQMLAEAVLPDGR